MALVLKDRVQETGTANTTVSFTLAGAVAGYQSFSAIGNTNTTYYTATDTSNNWEAGLGTYSTTGPTLTRTTILSSSNSGSAVTFSGTVNVFCTYPSSRALYLNDGSTGVNVSQAAFTTDGAVYATSTTALTSGTLPIASGGTNATSASAARTSLSAAQSGTNTDITSIALTSGTITATPTANTDIVNKQYADSIAEGINFHEACSYATTADLGTVTYNNGTSGVGATLTNAGAQAALAIDGYTFTATDATNATRVLVKNQTSSAQNGVYIVTNQGSGSTNWVLTRATDFDTAGSGVDTIAPGDFLLIVFGTANANTAWVQQTPLPITIGTTGIVFVQFGGASGGVSSFSAGSTGFTPSTATTGTVTLAGTLATTNGGTGLGGATPFTSTGIPYASSASALTTGSALTFDGTNFATTGRARATAFQFAGTTAAIPNPNSGFGYNSSNGNINVFSAGGTNIRLNQYGMNISPTDAAGVAKINVDPDGFTRWKEVGPTATNAFGIHIPSGTNTYGPFGTVAGANTVAFGSVQLAFGDSNDGATVTRATTLYIDGAPTAADVYTTIDSSYAVYVNSGESYFGNNIKIGSGANRGTTAGTNQIALFNGTAPVGTLTNGVSLYSSSGDLNFMDSAGAAYKVGFRNVPVNSQSAAYTTVLADSGKFIFHPSTDANARTFTIPANSSVAYDVGTVLTFVNMTSQVVTIGINTDTMYLAGAGTTGNRTLAQYGMATAIKMTATTWLISGVGIS
jgi:hypothetical protein